MITIAKGTLPLAVFGPQGYGLRSGLLSASARTVQAAAPFLFGLLLERVGIGAVGLSAGLCLAAFGSLFLLRPRRAVVTQPRRSAAECEALHCDYVRKPNLADTGGETGIDPGRAVFQTVAF